MNMLDCLKLGDDIKADSPERAMWLAVIDRAMADYFSEVEIPIAYRMALEPWFFEPISKPNNLLYICELLFDEPLEIATIIRQRVLAASKDRNTKIAMTANRKKRRLITMTGYNLRLIN